MGAGETGDLDRDEHSKESAGSALLYKRLLALHTQDDLEPVLDDAVRLIVEIAGAQLAIIELYYDGHPRHWRGYGRSIGELEQLRASISHGIVKYALDTMQTVVTTSASSDQRFADLESVRQRDIQAVLCVPLRGRHGVVYLQGRAEAGSFDEEARARSERSR